MAKAQDEVPELAAVHVVGASCRLVEEQHVWAADEGASDLEAPLLSAGEPIERKFALSSRPTSAITSSGGRGSALHAPVVPRPLLWCKAHAEVAQW